MSDFIGDKPRILSPAQLPIWRAEMLYRRTPRWTQMTVIQMTGQINIDKLENAIRQAITHYPALRTKLHIQQLQPSQTFPLLVDIRLQRHDQAVSITNQKVALDYFLTKAAGHQFSLYESSLFRTDLLIFGPDRHALVLRLHHIAADGIALALIVAYIAERYQSKTEEQKVDGAYKRWLDRQDKQVTPQVQAAQDFYDQELFDMIIHHENLYDRTSKETPHVPPNLPEATFTIDSKTTDALRHLANVNKVTLFVVLFAAYAAILKSVVKSPDLVIATFVSGRANEPEQLVGSCINTMLVRLKLENATTMADLIEVVKLSWYRVRQYQSIPLELLKKASSSIPLTQFAINYLDMKAASFDLPEIVSHVTHAQQGYPLNDLLLYALREQNGELRLRLIVGSGTSRLSQTRVDSILMHIIKFLQTIALFKCPFENSFDHINPM